MLLMPQPKIVDELSTGNIITHINYYENIFYTPFINFHIKQLTSFDTIDFNSFSFKGFKIKSEGIGTNGLIDNKYSSASPFSSDLTI